MLQLKTFVLFSQRLWWYRIYVPEVTCGLDDCTWDTQNHNVDPEIYYTMIYQKTKKLTHSYSNFTFYYLLIYVCFGQSITISLICRKRQKIYDLSISLQLCFWERSAYLYFFKFAKKSANVKTITYSLLAGTTVTRISWNKFNI